MVHANTCGDGYWTDITRTYTAGEPTARQNDIRAAISEAREAGLGAIRPGVMGRDVDHATRLVMKAHGLGKPSGTRPVTGSASRLRIRMAVRVFILSLRMCSKRE